MEATGVKFEMNPKTFTLQKLFHMQLEKFEEQIMEICSGASKELNIENGINAIADTWRIQRFEVVRYMKGTQERGQILRSTEEIQQTLEDQMMNLTSMMSSRFCTPFVELTHKCAPPPPLPRPCCCGCNPSSPNARTQRPAGGRS